MRIIHKDLKHGRVKLALETLDDLWHISHIIEPGDIVVAETWRREELEGDKIRPERMEKKKRVLSVKVKSVEFHRFANRLRVLGEIVEGQDVGKHHAFNFETGSTLALIKPWKAHHLDRLRDAVKASMRPKVLLVAMDDTGAGIGLVRQYGLDELGTISYAKSGKLYGSEHRADELKFFHKLAGTMKDIIEREGVRVAIVAGPGFVKDNFFNFLGEKYPELAEKVRKEDVSSGGRAGLHEIIRRGAMARVSAEDRLSYEASLVEKLKEEISRNGLATYGKSEVLQAAKLGAVEKLLIADELLKRGDAEVHQLLEQTRRTNGEVVVISTEHDWGRQLLALRGVAALLRFKQF
jgi:protein pelota